MNNEYYINTSGASNNNNASNAYAFLPDNAHDGERVSGVGSAEKREAMHWERATRQAGRPANPAADGVGLPASTPVHGGTLSEDARMASVLTFDGLMQAARQCALGVKWKDSIAAWTHPRSLALNCLRLKRELDSGTYRLGGYVVFEVTEPKRRTIRSPKFRDRVVQRAMCNAGLYRDLTRGNIHDNGACQNGKGTTFTLDRLDCHLQRYWRKHGADGWVLRLDIRRFFDSIPHDKLKEMVARRVRCEEFRRRVDEVIDSFDDPGIGLGSQISQLLAIAYLSDLDHYVKERLGVRHYLRYSDDIVMIHESREFLLRVWTDIAGRLAELGLQLNPKSTLHPLGHGVRFLKFRFVLTGTGRVVRILDRRSLAKIRRRLRKLKDKAARGERLWQDAVNSFNSWKAHAEQGNSHERIGRIRRWLES